MVVHIAPIGKNVAHVKEWLREVQPITKVWLIHSKKSDDYNFPKAAKDLAKKIQEDYAGVDVELQLSENPLNLDGTMDAIDAIISKEQKENDVEKYEFCINVTGGTNVMSAAAILSATFNGARAQYVLNRNMNPGQKRYVEELPIPPIGFAKNNKNQQKILQVISKSIHVLRGGDKIFEKFPGAVTNQALLTKPVPDWDRSRRLQYCGLP